MMTYMNSFQGSGLKNYRYTLAQSVSPPQKNLMTLAAEYLAAHSIVITITTSYYDNYC